MKGSFRVADYSRVDAIFRNRGYRDLAESFARVFLNIFAIMPGLEKQGPAHS